MKMATECGLTPRYGRFDRRIVAIAAMAAILLCATTGQAANTLFTIDSGTSLMALEIDVDFGSGFSGGARVTTFPPLLIRRGTSSLVLLRWTRM